MPGPRRSDEPADRPPTSSQGLSPIERQILDFERSWQTHRGTKVQAIRERFGVSPTAYYTWRAALVMRPEALAYAPVTVRQLRRGRVPDGTDRREPPTADGSTPGEA